MYSEKSYDIDFQKEVNFENGEVIVTCLNNVLNPIKQKYEYTTIEDHGDCKFIRIEDKID